MGRQPFRRRKADNSIDDGTGGGGTNNYGIIPNGDPIGATSEFKYIGLTDKPPYGNSRFDHTWLKDTLCKDQIQSFIPFIAPKTGTIAGLSIILTSPASSGSQAFSVGIYSDDEDGMPETRIAYTTFDVQGGSARSIRNTSFTGTPTITKGTQYWLSFNIVNDDAFTITGTAIYYNPIIGPMDSLPSTHYADNCFQFISYNTTNTTTPVASVARTDLEPWSVDDPSYSPTPGIWIDY